MLATLQSVLRKAQRGRYAVGAFNVSNLEQTQAVIQAAVKQRSPVIINTSEKAIAYAGLDEISGLVRSLAAKHPVPIVLCLDHGHQVKLAIKCLRAGYSGIMFDASRLTYQRNIEQTRAVVAAGRRLGVGVEGELGQVKYTHEIKKDPRLVLTDPVQAQAYVRRTGITALAVAIGNAHGVPIPHEHLLFPRLREIQKRVSVPLVLHGASGTPPASIRKAIALGICKINIDTDLRISFTQAIRQTLHRDRTMFDPRGYLSIARDQMRLVVERDMQVFRSRGRAKR